MGLLEARQLELPGDLPEPGCDQAAPGVTEHLARNGGHPLLRPEAVRKLSAQG